MRFFVKNEIKMSNFGIKTGCIFLGFQINLRFEQVCRRHMRSRFGMFEAVFPSDYPLCSRYSDAVCRYWRGSAFTRGEEIC